MLPVTAGAPRARGATNVQFDDRAAVLSENECLALLGAPDLGRVAFASEDTVEIFPANYAMEGSIICFGTSPGTKLDAVPNTGVAFEVDSWDPDTGAGWSVVAKGGAEEITTNIGRVAEHLRRLPVQPAAPGARWHWLAIRPAEITGRRFRVPPAAAERA